MALLSGIAVAAGGVGLAALHRRRSKGLRRRHAEIFADCLDLFDSCRVTQDGNDYAVLVGHYGGLKVKLEPVIDTLAWRKVPSLWLKATILNPQPCRGNLDFLVRPRGGEFYSPSAEFSYRVPPPARWPADSILCTDDPSTMPRPESLRTVIALFDDPQMKELVITPKGIRLVRQMWQAQRAPYLVLREVRFDQRQFDRTIIQGLLAGAIEIGRDLAKAGGLSEAA